MGNKNNKKIIGITGGMGPQASAEFYKMLIGKSISNYQARNNDDFPEILIDSIPVPDFISNIDNLNKARDMLIDRIERMNFYPVNFIGIACNTAHILIEELRLCSAVPIVSIIEEVKKTILTNGYRRVGLLSTKTTQDRGLYDSVEDSKIKLLKPNKDLQDLLEEIIRGVIAGKERTELEDKFKIICNYFIKEQKLDTVILGCTELPLIFPGDLDIKSINTLEILANSLLKLYFEQNYEN
ncbi:hypothetical protein A2W14_05115 [Candidatus Gottesmanbacteria bacterium RBG_16_37_8]|uniref:Aspartate racemase n=1 Tax=Candidatus Gottesmanbacteria bacterium RBG_16_37_8 TaxID=1798371 RepID=A0A1F5YR59_9BACT|nr:MAG: hypothetical protein A2W14_05115 [Candidatus Gottesmanbacteria bacterium RBG_16_37_8]